MSRYHWWGFLVNEAGEPIENAEITVKLAGTEELASLYYDEFGNANSSDNPALSAGPQLSTLSNGYYEFWIGDVTEPYGYRNDQKFKLEWIRIGVAHGEIDYINVFPLGPQTDPASITNCVDPSQEMNKLISNYLACKWDTHVESEVVLYTGEFSPVHGLDFINVEELDTVPNKIISNFYGWHWDHHRLSTVQDYHPSAGTPHGIEEVNPLDGSDTLRNKLVSNRDLYALDSGIDNLKAYVDAADTNLQIQIDELDYQVEQSKAGWWEIHGDEWILYEFDVYYVDIVHNQDIFFPFVQVIQRDSSELDTGKAITPTGIEYLDTNTVRILCENERAPADMNLNVIVRIGNGGIHRHPENGVI